MGDQDNGIPGRPVPSGLQVPGEPGHASTRQEFFLQNVLQLHRQRWVILRVDSLALWKIISKEDAVLIPKYRGGKFSCGFLHSEFFADFCTQNFLGQGEPLCRHSIDCCFISGHSAITRFCPWSPITTGNHLDCPPKNSKSCSDDWHH